jgi:hypothetical protein
MKKENPYFTMAITAKIYVSTGMTKIYDAEKVFIIFCTCWKSAGKCMKITEFSLHLALIIGVI